MQHFKPESLGLTPSPSLTSTENLTDYVINFCLSFLILDTEIREFIPPRMVMRVTGADACSVLTLVLLCSVFTGPAAGRLPSLLDRYSWSLLLSWHYLLNIFQAHLTERLLYGINFCYPLQNYLFYHIHVSDNRITIHAIFQTRNWIQT